MLTTCSEGGGALICSTDRVYGGNIPRWLILAISMYLMQVWEEMHAVGSPKPVRIGSMTPLPVLFLLTFFPMIGERGAGEQGPNRVLLLHFPSGIMFWKQWIISNLYPLSPFSLQPKNSEITLEIK